MAKLPANIAAFFDAAEHPIVYFAHPMSTYGSQLEKQVIAALEARGYTVFNPGAGWVQKEVQAYKKANPDTIMDLFAAICNACDGCAVLPFPATLAVDPLPDVPEPHEPPEAPAAEEDACDDSCDCDDEHDDDHDDWDTDEAPDYTPPPAPLMLGAGVVYEMATFFDRSAPVLEVTVNPDGTVNFKPIANFFGYRVLDVQQTRAALKQYRPE